MTVSEDNEKNEKQRMDLFYAYLKQRSAASDVDGAKAATDILHEAERSALFDVTLSVRLSRFPQLRIST